MAARTRARAGRRTRRISKAELPAREQLLAAGNRFLRLRMPISLPGLEWGGRRGGDTTRAAPGTGCVEGPSSRIPAFGRGQRQLEVNDLLDKVRGDGGHIHVIG